MPIVTVDECRALVEAGLRAEKAIAEMLTVESLAAVREFQHHFMIEMGSAGLIDAEAAAIYTANMQARVAELDRCIEALKEPD